MRPSLVLSSHLFKDNFMPVTPETSPALARVRELPAGDKVTGFYLLTKLETKPKRDGTPFLILHLQDSTGKIEAKKWEEFDDFVAAAKPGDVVKVEAAVDRYRDVPGLVVNRIRLTTPEEVTDRRAYLPHSTVTAAEASAMLNSTVDSLTNPHLKKLLQAVFEDAEYRKAFHEAPGGKMWHHAALGGLAEHTIQLARVADGICALYPSLNRDLLITGALLHDVGKVMEYTVEVGIDYSVEGRLIGHIVQGTLFVDRKISEIPDFPAEIRRQVLHLILSHQGEPTMSSPVRPMTPEALALHYLDELDSKLNAFERVRSNTPDGRDFSDYVNLMERFFYLKSIESPGMEDS